MHHARFMYIHIVHSIGLNSAPTVTVRPGGLSTLIIDMTTSVYGMECVDLYRVTASVGEVTKEESIPVTDPIQVMYTFVFMFLPPTDLCVNHLSSATAVGVTNGIEGTMASSVMDDAIDRSSRSSYLCFFHLNTCTSSLYFSNHHLSCICITVLYFSWCQCYSYLGGKCNVIISQIPGLMYEIQFLEYLSCTCTCARGKVIGFACGITLQNDYINH